MSKKDENLVVIDADSLVYIIAYKFADLQVRQLGIIALDDFIKDIFKQTRAKYYLGYFGAIGNKNFRYDIAVTKPYKGTRAEKEDYILWWEPILKGRMKEKWGFVPVEEMEADDACTIAANKHRGKFKKVIVSTPDKDLFQIVEMHFYDYKKANGIIYCNQTVANRHLFIQLITGDTTDNIQGCAGAGVKAATDFYDETDTTVTTNINEDFYVNRAKECYVEWYTIVLRDKYLKSEEKKFLIQYKKDNEIKRLTADIKSDALKEFKPDLSHIKTEKEVHVLFEEMYALIKMIDTEKEGKKHNFTLGPPIKEDCIDWDEIINYENDLDDMVDFNDEITILDDL